MAFGTSMVGSTLSDSSIFGRQDSFLEAALSIEPLKYRYLQGLGAAL